MGIVQPRAGEVEAMEWLFAPRMEKLKAGVKTTRLSRDDAANIRERLRVHWLRRRADSPAVA
jgi:hypothetical protein